MKISEISVDDIIEYIREEYPEPDEHSSITTQLKIMQSAAVAFMQRYTGQSAEYIEGHEEFTPVLLALVADMYDTRSYRVDNDKINPFVEAVLDMHRINLL